MKTALLFLCLTASTLTHAQYTLSDGQSVVGRGLWSENVAGISHSTDYALGISNDYAFGLSELSTSKISVVAPLNFGVLNANWSNRGDALYSENELALSFARHFSSFFQLGMRFRLNSTAVNHETQSVFLADIGMQSAITNQLSFGVELENPFRADLQSTSLEIGVAYWLSEKASLFLSTRKESDLPTSVIMHINYSLLEKVSFHAALSNTAFFNRFAVSYRLKGLSLELFLSHHSYLGFSPQVGISYSFGK